MIALDHAALDRAARDVILSSGGGALDFDSVSLTLAQLGVSDDEMLSVAALVIDTALSLFTDEIEPAFDAPRNGCYTGDKACTPRGRCWRSYGFGVIVSHGFDGEHWTCEGREFLTRTEAERHARRAILIFRLRSELGQRRTRGERA